MNGWTDLDDTHIYIEWYIIDYDETVKLTQGQGHKVKGQGHINVFV